MVVGVPLIVATFANQLPLTPAGSPLKLAPIAPVVAYVMLVIAALTHTLCAFVNAAELNVIVLVGLTVIVPVAVFVPPVQPPVIVTV